MRRSSDPVRLVVNPVACEAVGLCTHLAADVVELDRWGYPLVPTGPLSAGQRAAAGRAVRACPRRALSLVADSGSSGPGQLRAR